MEYDQVSWDIVEILSDFISAKSYALFLLWTRFASRVQRHTEKISSPSALVWRNFDRSRFRKSRFKKEIFYFNRCGKLN